LSVNKGFTRFDDPIIPQDLATKLYVDTEIAAIPPPAGGGQTFARIVKKADETVNNSSTLQDDDELLFTPAINKNYAGFLMYFVSTGSTPDLSAAFSIPSGATMLWLGNNQHFRHVETGSADATTRIDFGNTAGDRMQSTWFRLIMGATAGNCIFQWAQRVATVEDTKILAGSLLVVWEETA